MRRAQAPASPKKIPGALLPWGAALLLCAGGFAGGQKPGGDGIWRDLVVKENPSYRFSVPASWRQIEMPGGSGPEVYFEASGLALPAMYRGQPLIVTVFLARENGKDLDQVKQSAIRGYKENPDRVFEKNFSHQEEPYSLKSGERAYLVNTRFFRKSKDLYQSRFDLVTYSQTRRQGYCFTLSVQHGDKGYGVEQELGLKDLARELYRHFELK